MLTGHYLLSPFLPFWWFNANAIPEMISPTTVNAIPATANEIAVMVTPFSEFLIPYRTVRRAQAAR